MDSLDGHFERLYQRGEDPWRVRDAWYEQRKRELILAALCRQRYAHALEAGCGEGDMTLRLAQRCTQVCAVDGSPTAVQRCRIRVTAQQEQGVEVLALRLPGQWPDDRQSFDLAIVSEIAYYFSDADLAGFLRRLWHCLQPGAEVVACHFRTAFSDRRQHTDAIHEAIAHMPGMTLLVHHLETEFRLDVWRKQPPQQGHDDDRNLHSCP